MAQFVQTHSGGKPLAKALLYECYKY